MSAILILDPAIQADSVAFKDASQQKVSFIEWPTMDLVQHSVNNLYTLTKSTKIMLGVVWPDQHVAFPDFLDPENNTKAWWSNEISQLHQLVEFDGIWIDMNEPANFGTNEKDPWYWQQKQLEPLKCLNGPNSKYDIPPYQTINVYQWPYGNVLSSKTLCMLATTSRNKTRFYDTKNLYGLSEAIVTQKALFDATNKRGAVISRSTFPSSGHYAGHWLGDNSGKWEDLRTSAIGAQEFNLFGIPYVGSDICGYFSGAYPELCLRWQQLGAFHSFFRNHNGEGNPDHDPGVWPEVAAATRQANLFRYQYLPYLYSLHFDASLNGGSVIRPVFFEFPNDPNTHNLGYQFMWGPAIMAAPALFPGISEVDAYIPTTATWYSLRKDDYGQQVYSGKRKISAHKDELPPVFLRGGMIVPRQKPNTTTTESRKNAFELVIALPTDSAISKGQLFWDDGYSVIPNGNFNLYDYNQWNFACTHVNRVNSSTELIISTKKLSPSVKVPNLDIIEIFGYDVTPNFSTFEMKVNGQIIPAVVDKSKWVYDEKKKILHMETKDFIDLSKQGPIELTWKNTPQQKTTTTANVPITSTIFTTSPSHTLPTSITTTSSKNPDTTKSDTTTDVTSTNASEETTTSFGHRLNFSQNCFGVFIISFFVFHFNM